MFLPVFDNLEVDTKLQSYLSVRFSFTIGYYRNKTTTQTDKKDDITIRDEQVITNKET